MEQRAGRAGPGAVADAARKGCLAFAVLHEAAEYRMVAAGGIDFARHISRKTHDPPAAYAHPFRMRARKQEAAAISAAELRQCAENLRLLAAHHVAHGRRRNLH